MKLIAGNWFICKKNIFPRYTFFYFIFKYRRFFVIFKKCDIFMLMTSSSALKGFCFLPWKCVTIFRTGFSPKPCVGTLPLIISFSRLQEIHNLDCRSSSEGPVKRICIEFWECSTENGSKVIQKTQWIKCFTLMKNQSFFVNDHL